MDNILKPFTIDIPVGTEVTPLYSTKDTIPKDTVLNYTCTDTKSILDYMKLWVSAIKNNIPIDCIPYNTDIQYITAKGKYFKLITHKRKRIRKKNINRCLKGNLPTGETCTFKNCYPINMEME